MNENTTTTDWKELNIIRKASLVLEMWMDVWFLKKYI
jgi:hypothetical protein